MKFRFFLFALVLILPYGFISSAFADVLIEFGIQSGGDEITLVSDTNTVIESTRAGGKYSFSVGGTKLLTDKIEAQLSLGVISDTDYTKDDEASWERYPVNAILFYRTENFRLGFGATAHFFPKFKVSGATKNASTTYKDAFGALIEIDYRLNQDFHLGLRYTDITYDSEADGTRFDGSSVGVLLIVLF